MPLSIGILGATGYTGAELIRLLHSHQGSRITYCSSRQYNGRKIADILPFFQGTLDITLEDFDASAIRKRCDVVFSCLPHGTSAEFISQIVDSVKVVDLSADARIRNLATFEEWYGAHKNPALLEKAVYGLSEVYRDEIRQAALVANPGCYPTSILLPLIPLVEAGLIDTDGIVSDSKSGVSGAGRGLSLTTHICEAGESFSAYKVGGTHRHIPEIEQELSRAAGRQVTIEFTPHLIPITRGMLSTIYVATDAEEAELKDCISSYYLGSRFVHVLAKGFPATKDVRGTNNCLIGVAKNPRTNRAVIVSVIDNLTKGASGQAVQNMNLMLGLPEESGLDSLPLFP
ncbi:MAG TPA: N-acetyl-gamma-glutamyl-phosphate reductase [Deltaproteobacteria bacterium]|nr:N-acetyl-gamma-glutamyl-phosphate reductase [Deltaproteobacteria bacterium]HOI05694.1 N-acetyl-gamma-glutamyl-phosphate reductase [Deltaproteobacteria bacterium]